MKYLIGTAMILAVVGLTTFQKPYTLIALIKTPGEGGIVQDGYMTLSGCRTAGFDLYDAFRLDERVTVIWRCVK